MLKEVGFNFSVGLSFGVRGLGVRGQWGLGVSRGQRISIRVRGFRKDRVQGSSRGQGQSSELRRSGSELRRGGGCEFFEGGRLPEAGPTQAALMIIILMCIHPSLSLYIYIERERERDSLSLRMGIGHQQNLAERSHGGLLERDPWR